MRAMLETGKQKFIAKNYLKDDDWWKVPLHLSRVSNSHMDIL